MKKILVLGASGLVGSKFVELNKEKFEIQAPSHEELDLLNLNKLSEFLSNSLSEVVINFVAVTNVDAAEEEKGDTSGMVYKLNTLMVGNLSNMCRDLNKHLVHISTDYVFDGQKDREPYIEADKPTPINWYGMTKYLGEQEVATGGCSYSIARIEMPYSAQFDKKKDFARFFLENLKSGKEITAVEDQMITPVFVEDAVKALTVLTESQEKGIFHIASTDSITPYNFAKELAQQAKLDPTLIKPVKFAEFNQNRKASRPHNSWMSVKKFEEKFGVGILKTNKDGIKQFLK